jgi:cytochrome c oxidase cbb3-type subunit III
MIVCAIAAIGMLACRQQAGPAAVTVAPPVLDTSVGPWPGLATGADAGADAVTNPFAADLVALAEGRRFFLAYNCSGCHGDHGGGGMGPSLRDAAWIYGSSDARIADSIGKGRAFGMPAWAKMLTPAQIWQLTAYLKSLRTPREPEPPLSSHSDQVVNSRLERSQSP